MLSTCTCPSERAFWGKSSSRVPYYCGRILNDAWSHKAESFALSWRLFPSVDPLQHPPRALSVQGQRSALKWWPRAQWSALQGGPWPGSRLRRLLRERATPRRYCVYPLCCCGFVNALHHRFYFYPRHTPHPSEILHYLSPAINLTLTRRVRLLNVMSTSKKRARLSMGDRVQ